MMDAESEWAREKFFDVFVWKEKDVHVDELIKNSFLLKQRNNMSDPSEEKQTKNKNTKQMKERLGDKYH